MAIGDFVRKQFIDVIHWTEAEDGVLAYRFPMRDMEIQYGGVLTVREGQLAVFVNEGQVADAFGPGRYELETRTVPILTYLRNWDKAFESPFKSDVYFFSTRLQTGQRWGTQQPIVARDPELGAVRLRAFGMFSYAMSDPVTFHRRVSGTRDVYRTEELDAHLRNLVVQQLGATIAGSDVPFLDMAANQVELARHAAAELAAAFTELGLGLDTFTIEGLSLPEELQQRLDERIGMGMVGDLRSYTAFQVARSIPVAAANEGAGGAGVGAGLGAGMAMGKAMVDAMVPASSNGDHAAPPVAQSPAGPKFCPDCGTRLGRRANFCSECGSAQP